MIFNAEALQSAKSAEDDTRARPVEPSFEPRGLILIDTGPSRAGAHQMETFEICPRMFRLLQEARAEVQVAGQLPATFYLDRGSLVHIGLAHYHAQRAIREQGVVRVGDDQVRSADEMYDPLEAVHVAAHASIERKATLRESEMLVKRYIEWSEGAGPIPWQVLGIEVELGIMLTPSELYTARVDMLVRDRTTGRILVVDHKTAYNPADAPTMYGHSWQMLGIQEIGRERFGDKWGGVVLNCIASSREPKKLVMRAPPAVAPVLAGRWREMAIARRAELRAAQAADIADVPFRLSSCWRPREGLCPVYKACGVR